MALQMNNLKPKLVLFDVDGVLLDSLPQHLRICEDKSREYGLNLRIPTPLEFKRMIRAGVRISPMECFFRAVGFPPQDAERANIQYQEVFMRLYAPKPFLGVHETVKRLCGSGLTLGIVTSNVRANVVGALQDSIKYFSQDFVYTKDGIYGSSKAESIADAIHKLHVRPDDVLYVGDLPSDWDAAQVTGVKFLGVAYGWGISEDDTKFPVVGNVVEISNFVLDKNS